MTAEVLKFNNEENEDQFEGTQMEEMFGIEEEEQQATGVAKMTGNEFIKGLIAGLGLGAVGATGLWFNERRKRLALLKQFELTTAIAAAIAENKTVVQYDKKEIDLAERLQGNEFDAAEEIRERINNVKMRRKEKDRWLAATDKLMEITSIQDMDTVLEQATDAINKKIEQDVTEEIELDEE